MVSNCDTIREVEPSIVVKDIQNYALELENEMKLGKRTLKSTSKSMDHLIKKIEKQLAKIFLGFVQRFTGFEGVLSFDSVEVQPILSVEFPNSWSLPIVTLTCVAISIPNICKDATESLFNSVSEGILYTFLVDESLNSGEAKTKNEATKFLWHEVEFDNKHKWLGNTLKRSDFRGKTPREILKWFSDKAEVMIVENNKHNNKEMLENTQDKLIVANSMYRITQPIMLQCNEHISEKQLFTLLCDITASIVVACLTTLPRVIAMKCHESKIEQREASVRTSTKILGIAKKIIERVQVCELPSLEPDQMALIDDWRVYMKQSIPRTR